ncbi:hypothetical protein D3C81_229760 [compost metagenome]
MITISQMGIYVICCILSLAVALFMGIHQYQLEERLIELKVHNDPRVKYFSAAVRAFGTILWIILAAIFAGLMVYSDWSAKGL